MLAGVTGSACGSLSTATDVDFFSFVLPTNATYLGFTTAYSQQGIDFELSVEGQTFKLGEPNGPFKPGKTYAVKASTKGKVPASYRLGIEIKK